jgi:hypothetical protein
MLYIYWVTRERQGKGWHYIRLSFLFFALWNVDAFLNHWLETLLSPENYVGASSDWSLTLQGTSLSHLAFYVTKQDHFLCVPAALSLYHGLRRLDGKRDV